MVAGFAILGTIITNRSARRARLAHEYARRILGANVMAMARHDAADHIEDLHRSGIPARVAFANTNLVNLISDDEQLKASLGTFVVLNDGVGMNTASRLLYREPFPDNLNGTDFAPYFLDRCLIPLRVFLLGATPSVVVRATQIFASRWPRHCVVGFQNGFITPTDENEVFRQV
jgi:alpha-1,3-mannosyltransferase